MPEPGWVCEGCIYFVRMERCDAITLLTETRRLCGHPFMSSSQNGPHVLDPDLRVVACSMRLADPLAPIPAEGAPW